MAWREQGWVRCGQIWLGLAGLARMRVRIHGTPTIREDMVRVGMGVADLRYRGEFREWSVVLPIRFNTAVFTHEQIINLFNLGGFACGIGEWRPERGGSFGMYHVV